MQQRDIELTVDRIAVGDTLKENEHFILSQEHAPNDRVGDENGKVKERTFEGLDDAGILNAETVAEQFAKVNIGVLTDYVKRHLVTNEGAELFE
jgi:hypothetical protein